MKHIVVVIVSSIFHISSYYHLFNERLMLVYIDLIKLITTRGASSSTWNLQSCFFKRMQSDTSSCVLLKQSLKAQKKENVIMIHLSTVIFRLAARADLYDQRRSKNPVRLESRHKSNFRQSRTKFESKISILTFLK